MVRLPTPTFRLALVSRAAFPRTASPSSILDFRFWILDFGFICFSSVQDAHTTNQFISIY